MRHTDYFDTFLTNEVNLSKFKLEQLGTRDEEIYTALRSDTDIGADVLGKKRQGSWAQRTIIEPKSGKDFDGDVMFRLRLSPDWNETPFKYPNAVYGALARHPVLGKRDFERKARCVRIHYSGMHVDVVPYVVREDGSEAIINRDDNTFERTDPSAFTTWMRNQDGIANNNLRKVIRLIKYLRDHKNSFTGTRSIILTTLLGERVDPVKKLWTPQAYSDVPTALLTIVTDLDEWLALQFAKPHVADPSGTGLDFDHRWNDESFYYFKARMNVHAAQIRDAYEEEDHDASVAKWQELFGDAFTAPKTSSGGKFGAGSGEGAGAATTTSRTGRAG